MSQQPHVLSSISLKVLFILFSLFALIIAFVIFLINTQGYPKIKAESDKQIIQHGQQVIDVISSNIKSVCRLTQDLQDIGQHTPLNTAMFESAIDIKLNKQTMPLIGSAGIWVDKYQFDAAKAAQAFIKADINGRYHYIDSKGLFRLPYYELGWFQATKYTQPRRCIWGHAALTSSGNNLAISCAVSIHRKGRFWGATASNFHLNLVQKALKNVQKQTGGYVLLIDNADHIIASSDPKKIPFITDNNKVVRSFSDFVAENPHLKPIRNDIEQHKQHVSDSVTSYLNNTSKAGFELYDQHSQSPKGSFMTNLAAYQQPHNVIVNQMHESFLSDAQLEKDTVLNESASAYLFNVPDTYWKLLIVKPNSEVNAVASQFRNTLLSYLLGSLIFTGLLIYFFLNRSTLEPITRTTHLGQQATQIIDKQSFRDLSYVIFDTKRQDEIGLLNDTMTTLLQKVQQNEKQLADINKDLENKVTERTQALEDALKHLKSSQVQLIRSEKMATLGQMVAGVAHEVNTPLAYVKTNLEVILKTSQHYETMFDAVEQLQSIISQPRIDPKLFEEKLATLLSTAEEIKHLFPLCELNDASHDSLYGVAQISELIINLKNFARLDESKVKKVDLRDCIRSSLNMSKSTLKQVQVETNLPDIPLVSCAPSQINQVLINLINNAAQAMPDGKKGILTLSVHHDASHVFITVSDNGVGMSLAVKKHIFEPFFTTKKAGEGTGLGLAIAHQIIEQHKGSINVASTEHGGTQFTISLPINHT